jgi:hypothetical protein
MRLPQHEGQVPATQNPGCAPVSGIVGFWDSGGILENPEITSTSQDSLNPNGEKQAPAQNSGARAAPPPPAPPPTLEERFDGLRRKLGVAEADPPANTGNVQEPSGNGQQGVPPVRHRAPSTRAGRIDRPAKKQPGRRARRKAKR